MTTGFPMLDVALVAAVFAGIFYWMYSLSSRSHAQRLEQLRTRKQSKQAWDPNTYEGRRNRQ
jgi:Na+/melibiose symporter-like transporter